MEYNIINNKKQTINDDHITIDYIKIISILEFVFKKDH